MCWSLRMTCSTPGIAGRDAEVGQGQRRGERQERTDEKVTELNMTPLPRVVNPQNIRLSAGLAPRLIFQKHSAEHLPLSPSTFSLSVELGSLPAVLFVSPRLQAMGE